MQLVEFETLYWQAVSALPSLSRAAPPFSRIRVLFRLLCGPGTFHYRLVNLIVFSASWRGLALHDTVTFDWCQAQLQQVLSPDDEFVMNESTEIMPLTVTALKNTRLVQLAWRLLFTPR